MGWARGFVPIATGLGFFIPAAIRYFVLKGGAIADDESVYVFSARLLASGHLTAPSHPLKLFFDHAFMVNDGRMFSQYFLGWPAIMALGVPFDATGYVNAVVSGATVPGVYQLLKTNVGTAWARLGVLVFLTSPMIQIAAATEMSHTSTLAALVYAMWFATMSIRDGNPKTHFGFGLSLAVAFFIRPASAVAVAFPWAVVWAHRQLSRRAIVNVTYFGLPVVFLAVLFLLGNAELTGSAFRTPYQRVFAYGIENAFRFTHVSSARAGGTIMLSSGDLPQLLSTAGAGLLRLNMSLFGWPISFVFLPFAIGVRRASLWWASAGSYVLTHLWVYDVGIDTFGPTHWFEMALPILMLTMLGCQRLGTWAAKVSPEDGGLPRNLLLTFVVASVMLFSPYRSRAIAEIGAMTRAPNEVVKRRGIHDAIIFVNRPWAAHCDPRRPLVPRHFVFWWPVNDPDLENDVIWVNHLSVKQDRTLLAEFPGREGYVASWNRKQCELELIPIEEAAVRGVPNGFMGPHFGVINPYTDDLPPTGELPN